MTDRDLELYRAALRLAAVAFAQYALETDNPPAQAVDDFVEGFLQDAELRRAAGGGE